MRSCAWADPISSRYPGSSSAIGICFYTGFLGGPLLCEYTVCSVLHYITLQVRNSEEKSSSFNKHINKLFNVTINLPYSFFGPNWLLCLAVSVNCCGCALCATGLAAERETVAAAAANLFFGSGGAYWGASLASLTVSNYLVSPSRVRKHQTLS